MISRDILKKVRHIEIRTNRLVNDLFGGEYESVFKGQGMVFADVREYVPGDDVRMIDWNVTARSQQAFIKKFVEERELTVFFVIDMSGSQYFGSQQKLKSEIAAEITALLAFSAVQNNDKTGLVIVTDQVEKHIPVKKGKSHVLRVVREILSYEPKHRKTHLTAALSYLNNILNRTAVIFVISDFQDNGFDKSLKILSRKHDVIAIRLQDEREREIPPVGLIELEDQETGQRKLYDFTSSAFRKKFIEMANERNAQLDKLFKSSRIDQIPVLSSESYINAIVQFFKLREKRL